MAKLPPRLAPLHSFQATLHAAAAIVLFLEIAYPELLLEVRFAVVGAHSGIIVPGRRILCFFHVFLKDRTDIRPQHIDTLFPPKLPITIHCPDLVPLINQICFLDHFALAPFLRLKLPKLVLYFAKQFLFVSVG